MIQFNFLNQTNFHSNYFKVEGIGDKFEIYKFTYWLMIDAIRLNVSDLFSSGDWISESDSIGGIREYSNQDGASKSAVFGCSRVWVFCLIDDGHGTLKINLQC